MALVLATLPACLHKSSSSSKAAIGGGTTNPVGGTIPSGGSATLPAYCPAVTQHGVWTWIAGANTPAQGGNYGSLGVAAASNHLGARSGMAYWKDDHNTFWIFGGDGYDGAGEYASLRDMWKIDPVSKQTTWVSGPNTDIDGSHFGSKGVASTANYPDHYPSNFWKDLTGTFWYFAGGNYSNGLLKYIASDSTWTWVGGSEGTDYDGVFGTKGIAAVANIPPGRGGGASWTALDGTLWVFGGYGDIGGHGSGVLNDFWKFNPATNLWTWIGGDNAMDASGQRGTIKVASTSNIPEPREDSKTWVDKEGNFWLFGGAYQSGSSAAFYTDIWKYNPNANAWTWVSGPAETDQPANYGTKLVASASNIPGPRWGTMSWVDVDGNFWLFGGVHYDSNSNASFYLNDLWKFNPTTLQWTWMSGSTIPDQVGVYGALGVGAASNVPGAREASAALADDCNNLWLFGGENSTDYLNDLWVYTP